MLERKRGNTENGIMRVHILMIRRKMITMMTLMVRRINNVKDAAMKQAILQFCV